MRAMVSFHRAVVQQNNNCLQTEVQDHFGPRESYEPWPASPDTLLNSTGPCRRIPGPQNGHRPAQYACGEAESVDRSCVDLMFTIRLNRLYIELAMIQAALQASNHITSASARQYIMPTCELEFGSRLG